MNCSPCSSGVVRKSVALFLASFLPLTLMCLIIITFRISGARPPMNTFILVSQVMSAPQYLQFLLIHPSMSNTVHGYCWKLFTVFFGLWNLDIGRSFYPPICLSPNMSTLQAQFLEYFNALFPLAVLFAIASSVRLYDRGNRIIFLVWRPVNSCFARLRSIQTSLIDAFATFIILSHSPRICFLFSTSTSICIFSQWRIQGVIIPRPYLYIFWMGSSAVCSLSSSTLCCLHCDSTATSLSLPSEILSGLSE